MKKKHMQRHMDALARQLESMQRRERERQDLANGLFEMALADLSAGDVAVLTASGHLIRASVVEVKRGVDMIDASRGPSWSEHLPGIEHISIHLTPMPGMEAS